MDTAWKKKLIETALEYQKRAYTPYSHYNVGAALLTEGGVIYGGCNVENASYGMTNCGERTAFFKAISEGEKSFTAIAIVGGKTSGEGASFSDYAYPCGACRQVMKEFCKDDFLVIVAKDVQDYKEYTLEELLPHSFGGSNV